LLDREELEFFTAYFVPKKYLTRKHNFFDMVLVNRIKKRSLQIQKLLLQVHASQ
jgi:hypothetical protein